MTTEFEPASHSRHRNKSRSKKSKKDPEIKDIADIQRQERKSSRRRSREEKSQTTRQRESSSSSRQNHVSNEVLGSASRPGPGRSADGVRSRRGSLDGDDDLNQSKWHVEKKSSKDRRSSSKSTSRQRGHRTQHGNSSLMGSPNPCKDTIPFREEVDSQFPLKKRSRSCHGKSRSKPPRKRTSDASHQDDCVTINSRLTSSPQTMQCKHKVELSTGSSEGGSATTRTLSVSSRPLLSDSECDRFSDEISKNGSESYSRSSEFHTQSNESLSSVNEGREHESDDGVDDRSVSLLRQSHPETSRRRAQSDQALSRRRDEESYTRIHNRRAGKSVEDVADESREANLRHDKSREANLHHDNCAHVATKVWDSKANKETAFSMPLQSGMHKRCGVDDSSPAHMSILIEENSSRSSSSDDFTNDPHPALETPLVYFVLKRHPKLLSAVQAFYDFRWDVTYPLQNRIPCTRWLRKVKIILTWAELYLLIPFFSLLILEMIDTFVYPSVSMSGHLSRVPLIFAYLTAMKNNYLTFFLGLPSERAIKYHKFAASIAYVNGLLHTYVAYTFHLDKQSDHRVTGNHREDSFLFANSMHGGGTMILVLMTIMICASQRFIRHKVFEFFYLVHVVCALGMMGCAFYHTGVLVPILGSLTWGLDVVIRKVYMPLFRYPRRAKLHIISDTVIELCFPKQEGFDFNPGQYVYISVPELSILQWHPFSLSSSPKQKYVTLHIRNGGNWTKALYNLAKKGKKEISILLEGPYGSVGVDLTNPYKYQTVMLFSGGIGVTPMQSLCNSLMYEHNHGIRRLRKLSFVWIERDPVIMPEVDVVRRESLRHSAQSMPSTATSVRPGVAYDFAALDISTRSDMDGGTTLARQILSQIPPGLETDGDLENAYPSAEFGMVDDTEMTDMTESGCGQTPYLKDDGARMISIHTIPKRKRSWLQRQSSWFAGKEHLDDKSFFDQAYGLQSAQKGSPIDLQVYLTNKEMSDKTKKNLPPFVNTGRPNIDSLVREARHDALYNHQHRVAVCVCAPARIVNLCRKACAKYSDRYVVFDFHYEVFE